LRITDVAAVERAGPADIIFVDSSGKDAALRSSQAGACLVSAEMAAAVPPRALALIVEDPYRAFVQVVAALYPDAERPSSLFEMQGVAPSAFVHPAARMEAGVTVDPAALVGPRAEIGAGTTVGPAAVIGPGVRVGRDCSIGAGVSLTHALLGDRVIVEPGSRIGLAGSHSVDDRDSPKLGRVILQDKVIVGGNCTIDRGTERDTIVGEGTIIDSLVHIRADAVVGRYCRIMAANLSSQTGAPDDIDVTCADGLEYSSSRIAHYDPFEPGRKL
jgi:UDP-3-O-[3-hydroxymyristoyl] glucosamine N-acyltransferase